MCCHFVFQIAFEAFTRAKLYVITIGISHKSLNIRNFIKTRIVCRKTKNLLGLQTLSNLISYLIRPTFIRSFSYSRIRNWNIFSKCCSHFVKSITQLIHFIVSHRDCNVTNYQIIVLMNCWSSFDQMEVDIVHGKPCTMPMISEQWIKTMEILRRPYRSSNLYQRH